MDFEELHVTRSRMYDEIRGLDRAGLNKKPGSDGWSIGQICHHLILSEGLFADAIDYSLQSTKTVEAREKPIERALDRSMKSEAPKSSVPDSGPFQVTQILEGLENSREHLMKVLGQITDETVLIEKSVKHPKFGRLSLKQWIELLPMHESRHIEQIQECKSLQAR